MDDSVDAVVVSQRDLWDVPWIAYCTEFEDVLVDLLAADVVPLQRCQGRVATALAPRFRLRNLAARWPQLRSYTWDPPSRTYDLAIVVVNDLRQLGVLAAVPAWRSLARTFVAYVFEVWPVWVGAARPVVREVVDRLDHLFVGIRTGAEAVEALTTTAVTFVPPAVDVLTTRVFPDPADRRIDVSNRGRRAPAQHLALSEWAHRTGGFYEYDTLLDARIADGREHRRHYYEQTARSRVFVANPARFDLPDLCGGALEVGLRYLEAMACGTVVLGAHTGSAGLRRVLMDPPGSVELAAGVRHLAPAVQELLADHRHSVELGLANRSIAVAHHDVLHRWELMAAELGLGSTAAANVRRDALAAAADTLQA